VFTVVVGAYLKRVTYDSAGGAGRIALPASAVARVVADPRRNFGQPYFVHGGVKVEDVLDRWFAGESWEDLAADYGVPLAEIEDAVRVSKRRAAA
jgi:uncharacterized protein (DUF433 family)